MIFGRTFHQQYFVYTVWFAWRPVTLTDGRKVWLQNVKRARTYAGRSWQYCI